MKKKIFTLFLAICMICTILPFGALADGNYGIYIGKEPITEANKNDVLGDGTVKYDPSTGKLTLNNAKLTKDSLSIPDEENGYVAYTGILIGPDAGDVNIVLKGDNKVSAVAATNADECMAIAMVSESKLTFSGSGSLTVSAKGLDSKSLNSCSAIFAFNIEIKGGTITATSGDAGKNLDGVESTSVGVLCYDSLKISGGTLKASSGTAAISEAVFAGAFNMSGGKLTAVGGKSTEEVSSGVFVNSNSFKVSGGTLVAQGDMAIVAFNDAMDDFLVYNCPSGGKVYAGNDSSAKAWDKKTTFDNYKYVKIDFAKKTDDGNPFKDVKKGEFCYDPVLWAYKHNPQITSGVDATHFDPNGGCTRAHIVTFLWRANGCPAPKTTKNPFKDVKKGTFYYDAVLWAVENGITNGVDKTHFAPDQTCNRGEAVTFLWRADKKPVPASTKCPFKDVDKKAFYYDAMLWAVGENITNGVDTSHFAPKDTCTRGQIVTFLYRDLAK